MANSRLLRQSFLPRLFQRTFAAEVTATPIPRFVAYNPISLERADSSSELAEKVKKPWTELSKEDKIAIYRASFPYTVEQMVEQEPDTKKVIGGVSLLIAISLALFLFLKKNVSAEPPRTLNKEWADATNELLKKNRANPITGICSQ